MKTSKPGHDMRADVPTIGVETIRVSRDLELPLP
ncbi:MAG: UDP-2,3-diacylglucosamine diphosphatase LpxI domain-containing protein, partial [Rhodosalinus sp.]